MERTYSGRSYEELVAEGQAIVLAQSKSNWELGDKAVEVVGPAGDTEARGTNVGLKDYAEDIGVDYSALTVFRAVSTAFPAELTRVSSVPWTCYRMCYKADDRDDLIASFAAKFDGMKGPKSKPTTRNFQEHIGKQRTREYTQENARDTAQQALDDLEPKQQAEVITPVITKPEVAKEIVKDAPARASLSDAIFENVDQRLHDHAAEPEGGYTGLLSAEEILREIRSRIRDLRAVRIAPANRSAVAESARILSGQLSVTADLIEHPESATISDEELSAFLGGGA